MHRALADGQDQHLRGGGEQEGRLLSVPGQQKKPAEYLQEPLQLLKHVFRPSSKFCRDFFIFQAQSQLELSCIELA